MAVITSISMQKKRAGRVNIYIDGAFFCGMQLDTVVAHGLKAGDAVDIDALARIQFESEKSTALEKALKYVSGAFKTERQVRDWLKGKGYTQEVVDFVTESLAGYRYVDDAAYAQMYVAENGGVKGKKLMKYELVQRGVDARTAEEAISRVEDESEACRAAAVKYMRGKRIDDKFKAKLGNYLYGKGFSYDTIREVANALLDGGEDNGI